MRFVKAFLFQFLLVFIMLVLGSILDIILAALGEFTGTYSYALFIVIFGISGIFAAVSTISQPEKYKKPTVPLWVSLVFNLIIGALYYFLFAILEGGEYQPAFRSLAVMLVVSSLFFGWVYWRMGRSVFDVCETAQKANAVC